MSLKLWGFSYNYEDFQAQLFISMCIDLKKQKNHNQMSCTKITLNCVDVLKAPSEYV